MRVSVPGSSKRASASEHHRRRGGGPKSDPSSSRGELAKLVAVIFACALLIWMTFSSSAKSQNPRSLQLSENEGQQWAERDSRADGALGRKVAAVGFGTKLRNSVRSTAARVKDALHGQKVAGACSLAFKYDTSGAWTTPCDDNLIPLPLCAPVPQRLQQENVGPQGRAQALNVPTAPEHPVLVRARPGHRQDPQGRER